MTVLAEANEAVIDAERFERFWMFDTSDELKTELSPMVTLPPAPPSVRVIGSEAAKARSLASSVVVDITTN